MPARRARRANADPPACAPASAQRDRATRSSPAPRRRATGGTVPSLAPRAPRERSRSLPGAPRGSRGSRRRAERPLRGGLLDPAAMLARPALLLGAVGPAGLVAAAGGAHFDVVPVV